MTTITLPLMTAEAFFDWVHQPENRDRHFELEDGKVIEMSRPGERHGVVCGNVAYLLNGYVRLRRRGYVCVNDTGFIMGRDPDTVRGPDVILYDESRRFDELNPQYSDRPPKLAVEVLSPNDRWGHILRRVTRFLAVGVGMVWVVDPEDRTVSVFVPEQLPRVADEHEELTGNSVLPDFRCRVSEFFFVPGHG